MSSDQAFHPVVRPARTWCCFRSGTRYFAVDLKSVVEVIETDVLVRLPQSPKCILGLCTFRRDVIPVVRLAEELPEEPRQGRRVVLILRTEHGTWGVDIDRSGTLVTESSLLESRDKNDDGITAVVIGDVHKGETISSVIDAEATWHRLRSAIEREFLTIPDPRSSNSSTVE